MKVLLVDLEFDYGKKERGLNPIRVYGYQPAIEAQASQVDTFFYDSYLNRTDELQEPLLKAVETSQPDLVFFILFQNQIYPSTLDKIRDNYKTINWFGDDTWRFENFTKVFAPHFSYCITTDKFSIGKYKKLGVKNPILSQWAAIENVEPATFSGRYEYDVSFIGACNPYRQWFVGELKKNNIAVDCFGMGWPNGPVSNEKLNWIFRHSKINLNLSNSVHLDLRYLLSSPKSLLHSLRSKKMASQIKARNFEIPFMGGFQLTDYTPSIEDYFDVGREIACYSTLEDAVTQISYYLENDELREQIREKSHSRAQSEHGYSHRFQKIFKAIR